MTTLRVLFARLSGLFWKDSKDAELHDEIETHLELLAAEQIRNGLSPEEARVAARREFGRVEDTKEVYRERRGIPLLEQLIQDLRYAVRQAVKAPGFTSVVILSLALGIGANTMIFSVLDGLRLSSLPFPEPNRVVMLWFSPPNHPEQHSNATFANCVAIREGTQTLEHVGCMVNGSGANLSEDNQDAELSERLIGQECTTEMTSVMRVNPVYGRWFTFQDEQRGREPALVISYRLWQRRFGGSADIVGRRVHITGNQSAANDLATIRGVMPKGFEFLNTDVDYWLAFIPPTGAESSPSRRYTVAARLKPGVSIAQAQAEMSTLAVSISRDSPKTNKDWNIQVQSIEDAYLGSARTPFIALQGVVLFVLLIACANVASLLLAQGSAQQKELAVRSALGGSRGRLVRQLLTSSIFLGLIGGLAGLALGWAGIRILVRTLPSGFPQIQEMSINLSVCIFTATLAIVTGVVFGIVPAIQASRPDLIQVLTTAMRGSTAGKSHQNLRSMFVVGQVALAVVLLVGAGLMINSFLRLSGVALGFNPQNLMSFQMQLADAKFIHDTGRPTPSGSPETEVRPLFLEEGRDIQGRLLNISGVQDATIIVGVAPLSGASYGRLNFSRKGESLNSAEEEAQSADWYTVGPRYFSTLKVPILTGREFTDQDSRSGAPVVIVSDNMAKRYWPNDNPIGRQIQLAYFDEPVRQIVGVVGDVRQNTRIDPEPQLYIPFAQVPQFEEKRVSFGLQVLTFVVRSSSNSPQSLGSTLRSTVAEIDRTHPVFNMRPIEGYVSGQLDGYRQYVLMLAVFGATALLLATIGIYGIVAHSVSQRKSEIGIRVALGSTARQIMRLILGQGLTLIGTGMGLGLAASLGLTRLIRTALWGVSPTDPMTIVIVLVALSAVAFVACYVPARRALRVDPAFALRNE